MKEPAKLIFEASSWANKAPRKQVATLAHLLLFCLHNNLNYKQEALRKQGAIHAFEQEIEPTLAQYASLEQVAKGNQLITDFDTEALCKAYEVFFSKHDKKSSQTDTMLYFLLEGPYEQKWLRLAQQLCQKHQLDGVYLFQEQHETDLGFGTSYSENALPQAILGRDADLERHLGFLSLALRQQKHYLLEGQRGVGKTVFIKHLLALAKEQWQNATYPNLKQVEFLYFEDKDFMGSEEHNRLRLEKLYSHLRHHPIIVPVFDGFETLLNPQLGIHEAFTELFGAVLAGKNRSFILVMRTGAETQHQLLRQIKAVTLSPLPSQITQSIVKQHFAKLMSQNHLRLTISDEDVFSHQLINLAAERYPGRFFPEVALHLAESVMNRAENRIAYLQKAPLDQVILEDLWEHIAEEQSLHVELLGKNPEEFYLGVSARLKENLIGQDHAIEKVIDVLNLMAKQPPRRAPRGRFLFAGPPGVGKTHLGRQLAIQLGLGEEAFFVFNMSEYASQGARTRFMGADPGYVGYKSSRTIYDLVRARPSCVILLDEIDRADASIQDILLSILEGEGNDAEGNPVYFSQVIFIMTTNQGQDQVEEAYRQLRHKGASRHELAEQFSDEKLRNLILKGVLDETEARMKADLDQRLADIKETYLEQQDASFIEDYITLKQEAAQLERVQKKTPLDRALLDRVDFVIPFFPIQEPDYLQKILTLCLQRYGWQDCPESIRNTIVSEALENQQSARSIERLVMKHKLAVSA